MKDDRNLRRKIQARGWWFAAARPDGPAHIVKDHYESLCGSGFDSHLYVQAKNLCGHCRKKARKIFNEK